MQWEFLLQDLDDVISYMLSIFVLCSTYREYWVLPNTEQPHMRHFLMRTSLDDNIPTFLDEERNYSKMMHTQFPCAGFGLQCEELLTWQNLLEIFITITRYILTLLVIIVSLKCIDPNNQIRQFILNLFFACIPSDLLLGATKVLMLADLYTSVFDYEWTNLILYFTDYFCMLASFQFRILSLFVLCETCIIYLHPIIYRNWFKGRKTFLFYIVIHFIGNLISSPILFNSLWIAYTWQSIVPNFYFTFYYFLIILLTIATALLTFLASWYTIRYKNGLDSSDATKVQRQRLISLLAFSAPAHLTNIPVTVIAFCMLESQFFENPNKISYVPPFAYVANVTVDQFRTIIFALCTILALPSYRKATLNIIITHLCSCHSKQSDVAPNVRFITSSAPTEASLQPCESHPIRRTSKIHHDEDNYHRRNKAITAKTFTGT